MRLAQRTGWYVSPSPSSTADATHAYSSSRRRNDSCRWTSHQEHALEHACRSLTQVFTDTQQSHSTTTTGVSRARARSHPASRPATPPRGTSPRRSRHISACICRSFDGCHEADAGAAVTRPHMSTVHGGFVDDGSPKQHARPCSLSLRFTQPSNAARLAAGRCRRHQHHRGEACRIKSIQKPPPVG